LLIPEFTNLPFKYKEPTFHIWLQTINNFLSAYNVDGFVKSLKITILPITHPINSNSYKVDFGKF